VEGGLRKGSISLCGSSVRGTWKGVPLLGIRKDMGRRAQGMDISLRGGTAGEPGRGLVCRRFMRWKRLWRRASLSIGSPLVIMGGGAFTGNSDS